MTVVRSGDHGRELFLGECRNFYPVSAAIVVNDLDVVAAIGDAGVDERLCVGGTRECWNVNAVLGAVALGGSDEDAGGAKVRAGEILSSRFALAHVGVEFRIGEHAQFGGDAENQGLVKSYCPWVCMGV